MTSFWVLWCHQKSQKVLRIHFFFNFFFVEFRTRLIESYDELFGGGGNGSLDSVSQFSKKWGWYQSIYTLAHGDVRRFEDITELDVHTCFMMLTFEKEKNELEAKQIKKNFK